MADLSLYKLCLRKVTLYLKQGIYETCHENPFSSMPFNIVSDLMSATIKLHENALFGDLQVFLTSGKLLVTSGRLRELKIIPERDITDYEEYGLLHEVLDIFNPHSQELEVLHIPIRLSTDYLNFGVSRAIANVLRNSPKLKELVSFISFDLTSLRNCKKLRSVKLEFERQQPWYDFIAKENDHFQPHKCLKFFTFTSEDLDAISCADVVIILRHCPELTSLGCIELSKVFSLLHKMCFPPSELKLQYCFMRDKPYYDRGNYDHVNDVGINDALKYYPLMKELCIYASSINTVWYLRKLTNLISLNITAECLSNEGAVFRYALQEIGSRLQHLSFEIHFPVDISNILQCCPYLESLRICVESKPISASSIVHLPRLQRFCFSGTEDNFEKIFSQFSDCNQLTQLFLINAPNSLPDELLKLFLKRNSLSNLKTAYLKLVRLTELGFRKFLLKAPQLEKIEICDNVYQSYHFDRVRREVNPHVIFNKLSVSQYDEYFSKRTFKNSAFYSF